MAPEAQMQQTQMAPADPNFVNNAMGNVQQPVSNVAPVQQQAAMTQMGNGTVQQQAATSFPTDSMPTR